MMHDGSLRLPSMSCQCFLESYSVAGLLEPLHQPRLYIRQHLDHLAMFLQKITTAVHEDSTPSVYIFWAGSKRGSKSITTATTAAVMPSITLPSPSRSGRDAKAHCIACPLCRCAVLAHTQHWVNSSAGPEPIYRRWHPWA